MKLSTSVLIEGSLSALMGLAFSVGLAVAAVLVVTGGGPVASALSVGSVFVAFSAVSLWFTGKAFKSTWEIHKAFKGYEEQAAKEGNHDSG